MHLVYTGPASVLGAIYGAGECGPSILSEGVIAPARRGYPGPGTAAILSPRMLAERANTARLETWTKETNVYASVWVDKTH